MVGDGVGGFFDMLYNIFPDKYALVITLVFFTAVIALYAIFVYYFYRFLGKKNIIELNLNKYNQSENSFFIKFFAFLFYVLEYLIILPVLTLIWFAVFSSFLLLLSKSFDIATVLTISAALIASVRVTSYISQNLSRDLAKMLPFTLLA